MGPIEAARVYLERCAVMSRRTRKPMPYHFLSGVLGDNQEPFPDAKDNQYIF